MRKQHRSVLYNVMFPLWMLVWFPSWLWLALIPANYLIDRAVLWWSLSEMNDRQAFCRHHTWKICLAGFASDFIGSLLLLGAYLSFDAAGTGWAHDVVHGLGFNPFGHPVALIIALAAMAVSALCIYGLDLRILKTAGLGAAQAHSSAIRLALITAPYLFLFPSALLY
jgi:hypothetical protein